MATAGPTKAPTPIDAVDVRTSTQLPQAAVVRLANAEANADETMEPTAGMLEVAG